MDAAIAIPSENAIHESEDVDAIPVTVQESSLPG
jgi:hypothetical protein